jgi:DNA-binding HxlR family transcriptional regulator
MFFSAAAIQLRNAVNGEVSITPCVDYELTALGTSLQLPISNLGEWAYANRSKIAAARSRFDRDAASKKATISQRPSLQS